MHRLAVVTGTRAEYGLLRPVLQKLAQNKEIDLRLLVTGAHLSPDFGLTVTEIENDGPLGIEIDARLDILSPPPGAPPAAGRLLTAQRAAVCFTGCADYFAKTQPDALLVLGDRYEIYAASSAAAILDIPVAHISGGDVTAGADDDWFRHCITKMARLHFASCEEYRQRVIRMGEQPFTVFNVGGLGDENIRNMPLLDAAAFSASLGFALPQPFALVTFHPETLLDLPAGKQADILLGAMAQNSQLFYLCTKANADAGGQEINEKLTAFCVAHENAALVDSLGVQRYLSAMRAAAVVLGNSSSGVVETPSFGVPAVDVGGRQAGRATGQNVLHCALEVNHITAALQTALSPAFAATAKAAVSPYNGGDTSGKIVKILSRWLAGKERQAPKIFYDGENKA